VRLQHALKREIADTILDFDAKAGAGLIMDVETGEILAATSLPDFDPHDYQSAKDQEVFNRLTLGVYELGSSFKIFSTAALIEKTNAHMGQKFDVREPIEIGRFKIRDYHPEKRILSLPEVFIHSSNIGSAMMGQAVGTEYLKNFYGDLGLFDTPEFEISEMGRPLVPSPWRDVNTLTASYGHGVAVSPLQLVKATASIVNGGVIVNPTLIKSTNLKDLKKKRPDLRIVSPQTSHRMRQLMRLVVTEGTGAKAEVAGFLVGGKTGTAEKPGKGGYNRKKLISSFLGVFPMDAPRYVIFVMVDEPKGNKASYGYATGGWVGAPTVARVISNMVSILGMSPNNSQERFEDSLLQHVKTKEQIEQEKKEQKIAAH
jgi:cell division protein FtsI (penicillin-binding protein 3)